MNTEQELILEYKAKVEEALKQSQHYANLLGQMGFTVTVTGEKSDEIYLVRPMKEEYGTPPSK